MKVSIPGMSGSFGRLSEPTALMTKRARSSLSEPSASRRPTRHIDSSSCHSNAVTPVSKRQWGDRSYLSTIAPK